MLFSFARLREASEILVIIICLMFINEVCAIVSEYLIIEENAL